VRIQQHLDRQIAAQIGIASGMTVTSSSGAGCSRKLGFFGVGQQQFLDALPQSRVVARNLTCCPRTDTREHIRNSFAISLNAAIPVISVKAEMTMSGNRGGTRETCRRRSVLDLKVGRRLKSLSKQSFDQIGILGNYSLCGITSRTGWRIDGLVQTIEAPEVSD